MMLPEFAATFIGGQNEELSRLHPLKLESFPFNDVLFNFSSDEEPSKSYVELTLTSFPLRLRLSTYKARLRCAWSPSGSLPGVWISSMGCTSKLNVRCHNSNAPRYRQYIIVYALRFYLCCSDIYTSLVVYTKAGSRVAILRHDERANRVRVEELFSATSTLQKLYLKDNASR